MRLDDAGEFIINKLNQELPEYLNYHNSMHTLDVVESAYRLGQAEGISSADMELLLTAAYYHDSGFLVKMAGHEEESCRIARETLPGFNYNAGEIERICGMIMATRLPQSPKNYLEEILADADLDDLGRDDFFIIGDKLFLENTIYGDDIDPHAWRLKQLEFMQKHHYFTKSAINLRQAKKDANLERIKAQLES
ncbi:HD domain-containing protein [Mucilaginibacter sp. L3T2-6]|uniref:HD domain-containing protein n=1 Tax=Mucilaginibacter sp. L3T2-6 TaxID=3062491 RepID=UPI002674BC0D|nr:HD domain-containing protein [Mucilaginibacter sp. L3T2-6]MDO3643231.1 HD domain-containing protein [Mucilaginibacter sp. L3T2-6]MDV6215555.1 HD domain-containing protein [Mucilaginibacter sp. L3T2-6]